MVLLIKERGHLICMRPDKDHMLTDTSVDVRITDNIT
jgi:hypothetical protein